MIRIKTKPKNKEEKKEEVKDIEKKEEKNKEEAKDIEKKEEIKREKKNNKDSSEKLEQNNNILGNNQILEEIKKLKEELKEELIKKIDDEKKINEKSFQEIKALIYETNENNKKNDEK